MKPKIMLTAQFRNDEFASAERQQGVDHSPSNPGQLVDEPAVLGPEHAPGLVASIASSSLYTDAFYDATSDLRIVACWGVGFDKVNVEKATQVVGVIITVTPVHMDAVAEYTIAQWLATLKRIYTLNYLSHQGDFPLFALMKRNIRLWVSMVVDVSDKKLPCVPNRCWENMAVCLSTIYVPTLRKLQRGMAQKLLIRPLCSSKNATPFHSMYQAMRQDNCDL